MTTQLQLVDGVITSRDKPRRSKQGKSKEDEFAFQCLAHRLPVPARQLQFATNIGRKWQFDFAWPDYKLALEIEGLVVRKVAGQFVVSGRHASISGFKEDCEKYASATMLGWTVIRFEQSQVKSGLAIDYAMRCLAARGWKR